MPLPPWQIDHIALTIMLNRLCKGFHDSWLRRNYPQRLQLPKLLNCTQQFLLGIFNSFWCSTAHGYSRYMHRCTCFGYGGSRTSQHPTNSCRNSCWAGTSDQISSDNLPVYICTEQHIYCCNTTAVISENNTVKDTVLLCSHDRVLVVNWLAYCGHTKTFNADG